MYEDHTVEDKYLTNFSWWEKFLLKMDQAGERYDKEAFRAYVDYCFENQKSDPILDISNPTSKLAIKYVLNRVAKNDPRDTSFDLAASDGITDGDKIALMIAKGFKNNYVCKRIQLEIGLTDTGANIILDVLKNKELDELNLKGNNLTEKTFTLLDKIISDPNNRWSSLCIDFPQNKSASFNRLKRRQKVTVEDRPHMPQITLTAMLAKMRFQQKIRVYYHNKQNIHE